MDGATRPLHLEPIKQAETLDKRLWVGNLDPRVDEYQLLKIIRVYGNIEKLDMLFHRSGPSVGKPRGYAFVTYKSKKDAIKAMNSLDGQLLGSRRICVKFAKNNVHDEEKTKPELGIPVLAGPTSGESKLSIKTAIQSIEAKLKLMENKKAGDDFVVNKLAATETPVVAQYQNRKPINDNKLDGNRKRKHPYHRNR